MVDETTPGEEPPAKQPKYDQEFFLALAANGKEVWNAWRGNPANKDVRVTFVGVDFSEAPDDQIDFSGFEFGDHADFSWCKWRGADWEVIKEDLAAFAPGRAFFADADFGDGAQFMGAAFGDGANFTGVAFDDETFFDGAAFGDHADFSNGVFGSEASFHFATFGDFANFESTAFGDAASFVGVTFGNGIFFDRAVFGDRAFFTGAAFGFGLRFLDCAFYGSVHFDGHSVKQWSRELKALTYLADAEVGEALKKRHEESWSTYDSGPNHFLAIFFPNTRFLGQVSFSRRSFEDDADFTNARFYYPPHFDATTKDARIDFTGVEIGFVPPGKRAWTQDRNVPVKLRRLRKIAKETENHDLERDLYIEERKAERGVYWRQLLDDLEKAREELKKKFQEIDKQQKEVWSNSRHKAMARNAHRLGIAVTYARLAVHILWIAVMGAYWLLADYGRSFVRPAIALGLSWYGSYWLYRWVLSSIMATAPDIDRYKQAVWMLALGNTVPFVGPLTIDSEIKKFLFCPRCDAHTLAIPPEGYQLLVLSQNLLSIILVFFIGLALRNYFRIK